MPGALTGYEPIPDSMVGTGQRPGKPGSADSIGEQKDMFLQLLVAQLKNQDPSSPMDQKDMMAQMAQFTSVEQMTNMVKTLDTMNINATFSQSVGLIGRNVDYPVVASDGSTTVATAAVSSVGMLQGQVVMTLDNGAQIGPGDVIRVT